MTNKKVIFWAVILHIVSAIIAISTSLIQTNRIIKEIRKI